MMTGRPPFRAATIEKTAHQVVTQDPVIPRQIQPTIPADLETICLTCLQKNPASRYASAESLGEDLRRFLDDEPILALPTPLPDRVVKWARRRPGAALALAAGVLIVGGFFHAWGDWTCTLRAERDRARTECTQTAIQLQDALERLQECRQQLERLQAAQP